MKTLDEVKAAIRKLTPAELSELKMEIDESLNGTARADEASTELDGNQTRGDRVKAAEDFIFSNYKELLAKLAK